MSCLLDDVVGAYLDTLTEREFDAPFMAILLAWGFYDFHSLHGRFEFGKDLIAKRSQDGTVAQHAFQSKAGDIDTGEWRAIRGQIEDTRMTALAHPSFDTQLPRRIVLVTTGRLAGDAALNAQGYAKHLHNCCEGEFETWDRQRLIEFVVQEPALGLSGSTSESLLRLVGEIAEGEVSPKSLEKFSRAWVGDGAMQLEAAAVMALVLANRLRRADRIDLACTVSYTHLRA